MSVCTHQTIDTQYSADSVEWCPLADYQHLMLCGTYQLQEQDSKETSSQTRIGRLYMYSLDSQSQAPQINLTTSQDMPGILDIKWSYSLVDDRPHFALVNSVGQLQVFNVQDGDCVSMVTSAELHPESLGLSLEWDNMTGNSTAASRIASSDSKGRVHIHELTSSGLVALSTWKAHDYEAWITAFNQSDTNIVYTGGDDCRFKGWDLRCDPASPMFSSKRHSMGVCSIQSNPVQPHILATGSYDEQLLIWDTRNMKQPTTEIGLGGGIWRIKWQPHTAAYIATATMYNGFHVLDVQGADIKEVLHYKEHESLAYGIDWCRISPQQTSTLHDKQESQSTEECHSTDTRQDTDTVKDSENQTDLGAQEFIISTCSFYDHLLKLWTIKMDR